MSFIRFTETQKRARIMWIPGDVVVWRGIYRNQIWHAIPTLAVEDTSQGLVLALLPGTDCMVEENYPKGKKNNKRRWDFILENWRLKEFTWHTNRVLMILEPGKYYSTNLFWNHEKNEFVGYYVNFQLPFRRTHCGTDSLDLELDLEINPDFSFEWKDLHDYKKGVETGIIRSEWITEIENAKLEILERLKKRSYPFDGSWLNWMPDPTWDPAALPENWDQL
jgi:protein associated with RNAse G/E